MHCGHVGPSFSQCKLLLRHRLHPVDLGGSHSHSIAWTRGDRPSSMGPCQQNPVEGWTFVPYTSLLCGNSSNGPSSAVGVPWWVGLAWEEGSAERGVFL